jgi:hypothetical protein
MVTKYATTELEMVRDAREVLLAEGADEAALAANQLLIDKYSAESRSPIPVQGERQMPSGDGNGHGRAHANNTTPKKPQLDYMRTLLTRLWAPDNDTIEALYTKNAAKTRKEVSAIIDNLLAVLADQPRGATREQVEFLRVLWARKMETGNAELAAAFETKLTTFTFDQASKVIGQLNSLADRAAPAAAQAAGSAPAAKVTEGMYIAPDGTIFKVQVAHHGSGKLYAKQLVQMDTPREVRGKEVRFEFVYAAGSISRIQPEWRMTREQGKEFGDLYGACCRCGTVLTDELSIERGMGPTCYSKM